MGVRPAFHCGRFAARQLAICDGLLLCGCPQAGAQGATDREAIGRTIARGWGTRYGVLPGGQVGLFCPACSARIDGGTQRRLTA